jgi:acyl phosphate:glycerol-3-phosphate acyltransferase
METLSVVVVLIVAYLLGAIPFAFLIGMKFRGIDIRQHGSGNLGATNGVRVLGPKLGLSAGVLDVLKGLLPVALAQYVGTIWFDGSFPIDPLWVGFVAALGHCYPVYVGFRGGKAVATTIGVYAFLYPLETVVAFLISLGIVKVTKYVSLASSLFSVMFVVYGLVTDVGVDTLLPMIALMGLILWRHRSNYQRILNGTENKAKL